jgi:hypothetical protein
MEEKQPTKNELIKMALELLEGQWVQENVSRLGILGQTDIECSIKILKKAIDVKEEKET